MSKKNSSVGKSTKNLILDAAFSFYEETMVKDFSMNELAEKVGLSKPAIYRHYKNKDTILEAMKKYFFDLIAEKLTEFNENGKDLSDKEISEKIVKSIIVFFVENPHLINYFIYQTTLDSNFLNMMENEFFSRGIGSEFKGQRGSKIEIYYRAHDYFFGISILFFIKVREKNLKLGTKMKDAEYFANHLYNFLISGFKGNSKPGEIFYPVKISDERQAELDKICLVKPEYLPNEDKIFKAIASVIRKFTVNGVTIERIASELGMAKSSLYFYFDNKNQMIYSLVNKEINFLTTLCVENSAEAKNLSEHIYITLLTEINFFLIRPSVISICGWLIQTSTENSIEENKEKPEVNSHWEKTLGEFTQRLDLGFKMIPDVVKLWLGILPVAVTVLKSQNNFDNKKIIEAVKYIFGFVQNGIDVEKNLEEVK